MITVAGLLGVVCIILFREKLWLVWLLSLVVGMTDFFDGIIARRFNIKSYFGSALDRLRDKGYICSLLFILASWHWFSQDFFALRVLALFLVAGVIFIEISLFGFWIFGILKKLEIASNPYGRRKMFLQFIVVTVWLSSLTAEEYLGISLMGFSIYLLLLLLIAAIYLGFKSLGGHLERCWV